MHVLLALLTDVAVVGAFLSDCCNMLLGSLDSLQDSNTYTHAVVSDQCQTIMLWLNSKKFIILDIYLVLALIKIVQETDNGMAYS